MRRQRGFTLLELMIVVAIIGILSMIAVPSYTEYITRGKIQEATSQLSDLRVKMEQYYMDNRKYNAAATVCGIGAVPIAPPRVKYFTYACVSGGANAAGNEQTYTITATGSATEGMSGFAFTINEGNTKTTVITGGSPAEAAGWVGSGTCWVQKKGRRMLTRSPAAAGFSLIELMITLAVLGIVMMVGLPNVSVWIQNTQLKTAAEGVVSGLQLARAEALRRNVSVRFSLVDSIGNGCALSATGTSWVVSVTNPAGACGAAPSDDPMTPQIVQKKSGAEGAPNAAVAGVGGTASVFNGLGRLVGVGNLTQVNISNPTGGACMSAAGPMRCLAILIGSGGQVRMCDPSVADAADPRACGPDFIAF